jgi:hypothetical protein
VVHASAVPPAAWRAPHFADPDEIVTSVMRLIQASRQP